MEEGMERVLVRNKKYIGKYVAMKDFDNRTVVGYGNNPTEALKSAARKGYKAPVIVFVPEKATIHIY